MHDRTIMPMTDLNEIKNKGMYDPRYEHDACGMGFVADVKGKKSRKIIEKGLES
jgi:hypothetical protein